MICTVINNKVKCMMNDNVSNVSPLALILALMVVYIILVAVLQFAWNSSVTNVFNLPAVSFSDAFGLLVVSMILFKM